MKNFLVLLLLISFSASAQYDSTRQRQVNSSYGFDFKNVKVIGSNVIPLDTFKLAVRDSGAIAYKDGIVFVWNGQKWNVQNSGIIPSFCGVPTLRGSVVGNQAAIAFDSCNSLLYVYNPKDSSWNVITGGGFDSLSYNSDSSKYLFFNNGTVRDSIPTGKTVINLHYPLYWNAVDTSINFRGDSLVSPLKYAGSVDSADYVGKTLIPKEYLESRIAALGATVIQTVTDSSVTVNNNTTWLIVNPASTLTSLTVTLAASPSDGQDLIISFGGTMTTGTVVTALTVNPNTGQVIIQASTPVDVQAGEMIAYRFTNSKWYRQ